jgi:hypothetical protein
MSKVHRPRLLVALLMGLALTGLRSADATETSCVSNGNSVATLVEGSWVCAGDGSGCSACATLDPPGHPSGTWVFRIWDWSLDFELTLTCESGQGC